MAEASRVGIIGGGWPGQAHARGYKDAGGFKLVAVADLIPERRKKLMFEFGIDKEYAEATDLLEIMSAGVTRERIAVSDGVLDEIPTTRKEGATDADGPVLKTGSPTRCEKGKHEQHEDKGEGRELGGDQQAEH